MDTEEPEIFIGVIPRIIVNEERFVIYELSI